MFSPYYHWAGRRDPENHCCLNVALYGPNSRWTMTERPGRVVERRPDRFRIGPSELRWEDGGLTLEIDEIAVPHLRPVRGRIRLVPSALTGVEAVLDAGGRHIWRPFAPISTVTVEMERPGQSWTGHGYLDGNWGSRGLEHDFIRWDWSRGAVGRDAAVFYEASRRDGSDLSLSLRFRPDGSVAEVEAPPPARLPGTLWRMRPRGTRADAGTKVRVAKRLEDSPFYARAMLESRLHGERAEIVHESLDLDRFASRWVKLLLPWRMPRQFW